MSYLDTNNTIIEEVDRTRQQLNYNNIHVVEDFDEASQFVYTGTDTMVEVGTPVGFDGTPDNSGVPFILFDGIEYRPNE